MENKRTKKNIRSAATHIVAKSFKELEWLF